MDFLDKLDVPHITPGRRDHIYKGIVKGIKSFLLKRYFLWNLRDSLDIENGT